jgi:phosphohistidine phosphatase
MIIYFLRHASAGEPVANPKKDEKRGLDESGIEQCGYVGRALAAMDVQVDAVISSPLKRASQTAALVGNEIGYEGNVHFSDSLRPNATFSQFRDLLRQHSRAEAVMVVGHNPNFGEFLGRVISDNGGEAEIDMKKGSVARVEMKRNTGVLHWCITPKLARVLQTASTTNSRPKTSRK